MAGRRWGPSRTSTSPPHHGPRAPYEKKRTPRRRRPRSHAVRIAPLGARFDLLCLSVADRNHPRLQPLGYVANELNVQETVLEVGTPDLHVVGQLEAPLEAASGDAAMEELSLLVLRLLFAAN